MRFISPLMPTASARRLAALLLTLGLVASGCSLSTGEQTGAKERDVVIVTHDSWAAPKALIRQFERDSGYSLTVLKSGDVGAMTSKLVLTKDAPIGDGVYGVDNTFASRLLDEDVLAEYRSSDLPPSTYDVADGADRLTPIDWGDVCVNADDAWFAAHHRAAPRTLDDLADPAYANLLVSPGAASSSTGFAFLLATIDRYGDPGWEDYWRRLMANGTRLVNGWTDAYEVDFTAGGGHGDRPLVVSYNSSPPFTIPEGAVRPTTHALLDTCFRQVEYAGVLAGASNPEGARAFIDFMVGRRFQESLPENMYVFPVRDDATLPRDWAKWAPRAPHPYAVDPVQVAANRRSWLTTWADLSS